MDRAGLKNLSKQQLKGHWKVPVLITLMYFVLTIILELISLNSVILSCLFFIITLVISVWVCVAIPNFYLQFIKKSGEATYKDLKVSKKAILKSLGFTVIIFIITIIVGAIVAMLLATSIGCIFFMSSSYMSWLSWIGTGVIVLIYIGLVIFTLATALVPYIFVDKEELSMFDSIVLSIKMMKGSKWKLFVLQLSFIGWIILAIITVIGFIWLVPYMQMTITNFYKGLDYSNDIY